MRVCQFRHDGLDTTAAVSATSAEVGRIWRTTKPASRKELHLHSTEASLAVKLATLGEVYESQPKGTKKIKEKIAAVPSCTLVPLVFTNSISRSDVRRPRS